jgi:hypothetical protein
LDAALDLLAQCPPDPADVQDQHLEALEAVVEVVARMGLAIQAERVALVRRLQHDDDEDDIRGALDASDRLAARALRHGRASEVLMDYLQHTPLASDLGLDDPTEEPPTSPRNTA